MNPTEFIHCGYCGTANMKEDDYCTGCGAPIEPEVGRTVSQVSPAKITPIPKPTPIPRQPRQINRSVKPTPTSRPKPGDPLREMGGGIDNVINSGLMVYGIAWRTVAEAASIALVSFILGLVGGITDMWFWGLIGAGLLGIAVGMTVKRVYLTLLGAPAGALIGLGVSGVLWVGGISPDSLIFIVTGLGLLGAVLGGQRRPRYASRNFWEKARPYLGLLGGLVFGLIGTVLGFFLVSVINQLSQ